MRDIAWTRICCPVDFSEESRAALKVAVDLCRRLGAELSLLHVADPAHPSAAQQAVWRREAEAAGVKAAAVEANGDPKKAIAEWAAHNEVDAIVMGTHGRTGRARSLVGSVAESTVRIARCPVMVVHADWPGLPR
jgi:nucleotide-binding universal stress UspA family protein